MQIEQMVNISKDELENKAYNIYIAISLGNKYFSKNNLKEYIEWALENTSDKVLIIIFDLFQAINNEVLDRCNNLTAQKKAERMANEKLEILNSILSSFSPKKSGQIQIVGLNEIISEDENYESQKEILIEEFNKKEVFYSKITQIVKNNFKRNPRNFSIEDIEKLSQYALFEIPIFLNGITFGDSYYELQIYPGISEIDNLMIEIEKQSIEGVSSKIILKDKRRLVEAYCEN